MLSEKGWQMIRILKNQGISNSEIARQLNIDVKTVRSYLKLNEPKKYQREKSDSVLDNYKKYLDGRLLKYNLTSKKLFHEILKQGYKGKYGIVNRYVKLLKDAHRAKAVLMFETMPGQQAQVDWGYFGKFYDQKLQKEIRLCCFVMILGYSRTKFIHFFDGDNTNNFLLGHNKAFEYFGGYPREILYDNLKSVVIKRAFRAKDSDFNKTFLEFSGFYGFNPILARPYKPNTKGKVENSVKYVRTSFFEGEEFNSLDEINKESLNWLNKVNTEIHSTTKVKPFDRLKQEGLSPVHNRMFDLSTVFYRKVFIDSHFNFLNKKYSVPYEYVNKEVSIKFNENIIDVYYREKRIATHVRDFSNQLYITNKEHLEGLYKKRFGSGTRKPSKNKNNKNKDENYNNEILLTNKNNVIFEKVEQRNLNIYQGVCQ